ncbi:MAG: GPW/gp25 family protein [Chloroflexi bacterium]|nr:GPW/gp25 family protein [Chloroflexota bacterium]
MTSSIVGRGWAFPPQLGINRTLALTDLHNEIEQSIAIILSTAPGERVMRPTFGSRLHELVFAPNNAETAIIARRYVEEALKMWEPRLEILDIQIDQVFNPDGMLLITLNYEIKSTHDKRSLVYPYYLIPQE